MNPIREQIDLMTRRHFFGRTGLSLGTAALSTLLGQAARGAASRHRRCEHATGGLPGCLISRPRPSGPFICI